MDRDKNQQNEIGLEARSCYVVQQDHKAFVSLFLKTPSFRFINNHTFTINKQPLPVYLTVLLKLKISAAEGKD